jgi:type I restriction enzyme S subunit
MASEWIDCALADACSSIDYGLTASASAHDVGPRFLRITDIVTGHIDWNAVPHVAAGDATAAKYRLHDGDVVLARTGASTGASAYVKNPSPAVFASYLVRLQAKPEFDARFLAYYLRSDDFWTFIRGVLGDKSAQPNASASTMTKAPLRAPKDKDEQRAIAHILGTLDDKIELNRRMNETLEAMARALFKSWFVDFDPVRAKAEGRDPGLPKSLADLFPDSFEDSELGEIPKGWEVKPIGDLANVVGGTTPSTKEPAYWEGGTHAWATPKDLSALSVPVLLDTERRITDAGLSQVGSGLLPKGTVLLSSRAPIGYLAVAEIPVAINQGFIAMTPKTGTSNIFLLLWTSVANEAILSRANGSTFLEISKANFRPIPVVAPSATVMSVFDRLARPTYERIVECARESRTLAALRDALLPRLISGELRVKDGGNTVETG